MAANITVLTNRVTEKHFFKMLPPLCPLHRLNV